MMGLRTRLFFYVGAISLQSGTAETGLELTI